jgi:hypothetical protein
LRSPACENPTAAWPQGYLTRPIFLRAVRRELRLTDRVISDALVARAFAALTLARSSGGDDVLLETDLAAFLAAESSAEAKRSDTPRCVPTAAPSEQADGGADGSDPPLAVADGITTPVWARIGPSPTLAQATLPRGLRRRPSPSAFAVGLRRPLRRAPRDGRTLRAQLRGVPPSPSLEAESTVEAVGAHEYLICPSRVDRVRATRRARCRRSLHAPPPRCACVARPPVLGRRDRSQWQGQQRTPLRTWSARY